MSLFYWLLLVGYSALLAALALFVKHKITHSLRSWLALVGVVLFGSALELVIVSSVAAMLNGVNLVAIWSSQSLYELQFTLVHLLMMASITFVITMLLLTVYGVWKSGWTFFKGAKPS